MRAKLSEVKDQLKRRRHRPIPLQGRWLAGVVRGHLAYYAVPGSTEAVRAKSGPYRDRLCHVVQQRIIRRPVLGGLLSEYRRAA